MLLLRAATHTFAVVTLTMSFALPDVSLTAVSGRLERARRLLWACTHSVVLASATRSVA